MKILRVLVAVALFAALGIAQQSKPQAPSGAAFDKLKTLAGHWQGPGTVDDPAWATPNSVSLTMRVVSQGNAVIHELKSANTWEVTMFYVDGDRLTLVHYCDFKNRPRLVARPSVDENKIEFDFVDMTGIDAPGHVTHAVFTIIDVNHHTESWTGEIPGQKPFHIVMDLKRVQ